MINTAVAKLELPEAYPKQRAIYVVFPEMEYAEGWAMCLEIAKPRRHPIMRRLRWAWEVLRGNAFACDWRGYPAPEDSPSDLEELEQAAKDFRAGKFESARSVLDAIRQASV